MNITPKMAEVIKEVAGHLAKQRRRSIRDLENTCLYRGPNGAKCAVGFLIDDDLYDPLMEDEGIIEVMANFPGVADSLMGRIGEEGRPSYRTGRFFGIIQSYHDSAGGGLYAYRKDLNDAALNKTSDEELAGIIESHITEVVQRVE